MSVLHVRQQLIERWWWKAELYHAACCRVRLQTAAQQTMPAPPRRDPLL